MPSTLEFLVALHVDSPECSSRTEYLQELKRLTLNARGQLLAWLRQRDPNAELTVKEEDQTAIPCVYVMSTREVLDEILINAATRPHIIEAVTDGEREVRFTPAAV